MNAFRTMWLTWKLHRFEMSFALAAAALVTVSALFTAHRIDSIGLSEACLSGGGPACDLQMLRAYGSINGADGGYLRVILTVAPLLIGVVLGTPLVAREIEQRTAWLPWSLSGRRRSWLVARTLPSLLVAFVALGLLSLGGTLLFDAIWNGYQQVELGEIGAQSLPALARGLAALAVSLLVGSLVGRTLPTILIAGALMSGWALVIVAPAQDALSRERGVWASEDSEGHATLAIVDRAHFDLSRPGVDGEPGARFDREAAEAAFESEREAACGPYPRDVTGDESAAWRRAWRAWERCTEPITQRARALLIGSQWSRHVPVSAWSDFETLDVVMSGVLGGSALLLTFPVVVRRKPQ
ncbi:MAG: hypothetical protein KF809_15260 [Chloroflexi bacterium]|nr:hypothetical protein [Chloroflexota bacterium]